MGPKAKKPTKNAFAIFLDEYIIGQRENGRTVSHRIAAEECGNLWTNLSEEDKQKYVDLAAAYKAGSKEDKANKFTSTGVSYEELERQQKELKEKTDKADAEIKATISSLQGESLKTHLFYIIHCNYYCKTDEGMYVPGEIALVEFNLKDGIKRNYHTLISPGQIPLGYAFEARQTVEEVHDLPYPPYKEGDTDYSGIYEKILDFLKPGKLPDGRYPPLYCIENNIKASESILSKLSETSDEENFFRVYHLPKLFFLLKNKCVEEKKDFSIGFPVYCNAQSEIAKDIFCYVPGISCAFHVTSEDKYHSCSLSVVQRNVYVICDHCCQYLGVELVPGKHCRLRAGTQKSTSIKTKREPISIPPSEVGETEFDGLSSYAESSALDREDPYSFTVQGEPEKAQSLDVSPTCSRPTDRDRGGNSPAHSSRGGTKEDLFAGARNKRYSKQ